MKISALNLPFLRYTLFFALLFSIQSCTQTSFKYFSRKPNFRPSDNILIAEVIGLPPTESYKLFEWACTKIDTQQHHLLYTSEQEYTLMQHGINLQELYQSELPKDLLKNIHTVLGVDYLLLAERLPLGGIDTPLPDNDTYEAILMFRLYNLLNDTYSYHYRIKTTVHPFEFGEDAGILSGTSFNISSDERAAIIAFKKGWKKLSRKLR